MQGGGGGARSRNSPRGAARLQGSAPRPSPSLSPRTHSAGSPRAHRHARRPGLHQVVHVWLCAALGLAGWPAWSVPPPAAKRRALPFPRERRSSGAALAPSQVGRQPVGLAVEFHAEGDARVAGLQPDGAVGGRGRAAVRRCRRAHWHGRIVQQGADPAARTDARPERGRRAAAAATSALRPAAARCVRRATGRWCGLRRGGQPTAPVDQAP
jgi:hypothetical protein